MKLCPEQNYVTEIACARGIETTLVYHPRATNTCYEKAALLGWRPEQIIKALYFRSSSHRVGVVLPEFGRKISLKKLLPAVFGFSREEASLYNSQGAIPAGMEPGTCSPFPLESSMGREIQDIIIYDFSDLDQRVTDISVGGIGEEAHRTSMHLPYDAIFTILKQQFGGKIHKVSQETFL